MKRRTLGVLGASSMLALSAGRGRAATTEQAALLKTTLTPLGAERAGNAAGTIPAWTGGFNTMPPGLDVNKPMPDFFASDPLVLTINAANMAQHAGQLSDGVQWMMQRLGFSINVYPTRRTMCAPQWVYNNTYQNALNAKPDPKGARFGFTGAYGGPPFPIPEPGPNQGAEIIWNHLCRWFGPNYNGRISGFVVSNGVPALAATFQVYQNNAYYDPNGTFASSGGLLDRLQVDFLAPEVDYGEDVIQIDSTDPGAHPQEIWELLQGQGRVRKAPELAFDTPAAPLDGVGNYDEFFGFYGAPVRYDWKLVEKKEMYIPYNNNGQFLHEPSEVLGPKFVNPAITRWELHRVWVIDATLAPGERNVIPHRRLYIDEDTWSVAVVDAWDAQGNIWHVSNVFNIVVPDLPGTIYAKLALYNVQTNQYVLTTGPWGDSKYGGPITFTPDNPSLFNPIALAAQSQF